MQQTFVGGIDLPINFQIRPLKLTVYSDFFPERPAETPAYFGLQEKIKNPTHCFSFVF